jgi:transcription antitermination factor NusG
MEKVPLKNKSSPPNNWMVIYTRSNWEKKAVKLLADQNIISFCPLIKVSKKWSDRSKTVEQPLFKSYVFVYVNTYDQLKVQETTGVLNFVTHCGRAVTVTEPEIDRIKTIIDTYSEIEVIDTRQFNRGDKILIKNGPLVDFEGEIVDVQNTNVLMVLDQLGCTIIVKVNKSEILHSN